MSQSATHAWAFYREVAETRVLWTVRDDGGVPASLMSGGRRSMPFWSSRSRVERIIASVPAYARFEPYEVSWEEFRTSSVPELAAEGRLVGVNWSGPRAVGFDLKPEQVVESVLAQMEQPV